MAVAIRLRREGSKNNPFYRVVAADSRSPRDGKFIELLGTYDPAKEADKAELKIERIDHWITNGAQPSDTVKSLLKQARKAAAAAE